MLMPLEDYLDRRAYQYGFDDYESLKAAGYSIDIPETVPGPEQDSLERE